MGWVYEPMNVIEPLTNFTRGSHKIEEHNAPTDTADPHHLGHRLAGISKVVQRASAVHDVKGFVDERQRFCVGLLQQDVGDPLVVQPLGTDLQQRRGEVYPDDLSDVSGEGFSRVGSTASNIEEDHVLVQRFDPRQGSGGAMGKGRVGTGK